MGAMSRLAAALLGLGSAGALQPQPGNESLFRELGCGGQEKAAGDLAQRLQDAWCCLHHKKRCPLPFDCEVGFDSWQASWSEDKKAWCCEHEHRGCSFDCIANYSDWEEAWSETKKRWCCENRDLGCLSSDRALEPYDCQKEYHLRAEWSQRQRVWCCLNKELGCFLPTTSTTTTVSSTTATTTTTAPCFEEEVNWEPLDMPGTLAAREESPEACQRRCAGTPGCVHFSFWHLGKSCHLQDAYALRQTSRLGFVSGPFGCWENLNQTQFIRKGGSTFVQKSFQCAEIGALYTPALGLPKALERRRGGSIEAVKACREHCASVEGCAHYTYLFPGRLCQLAGPEAKKIERYMGAVSGSPTCWAGEEHASVVDDGGLEVVMKAELPAGLHWNTAGPALLITAVAAIAFGAILAVRKARSGGRYSAAARYLEE